MILGKKSGILYGEDVYTEQLLSYTFEISHHSFYQANLSQTEALYQKVIEFADLTGEETVIDAYSGIGTISLALSEKVEHVYGVEIVAPAVENAKRNAELKGVEMFPSK